ncbi:hypothetical protein VTK73DRAFT_174 [Phialemonium thermophilum]|uniref:Uncharacterized protein n=1 Tax=Phialemonium thermophilum TaxID=223376 RepID=A0ABR3VWJ5_9PEZI
MAGRELYPFLTTVSKQARMWRLRCDLARPGSPSGMFLSQPAHLPLWSGQLAVWRKQERTYIPVRERGGCFPDSLSGPSTGAAWRDNAIVLLSHHFTNVSYAPGGTAQDTLLLLDMLSLCTMNVEVALCSFMTYKSPGFSRRGKSIAPYAVQGMDAATGFRPCSCAADVAVAWKHIDSMGEITFDLILMASEQTLDFSGQWRACQTPGCTSSPAIRTTLLRIYARLVDLLGAAVATYGEATTTTTPPLANATASSSSDTKASGGTHRPPWAWPSSQPQSRPVVPALPFTCLPSQMRLGEHELDEQQSRVLALDLVCRTLHNFAHELRRMERRGHGGDLSKMDGGLLEVLYRVTRLTDATVAALAALQRPSAHHSPRMRG